MNNLAEQNLNKMQRIRKKIKEEKKAKAAVIAAAAAAAAIPKFPKEYGEQRDTDVVPGDKKEDVPPSHSYFSKMLWWWK